MRKLFIVVLVLALTGCSMLTDPGYLPIVSSIDEAWAISGSIVYVTESGDHWQYPSETYKKGTGDCEDMAALLLALIERSDLGTGHIVIVDMDSSGGKLYHALVEIDGYHPGWYLEPSGAGSFWAKGYRVVAELTMNEYLNHSGSFIW